MELTIYHTNDIHSHFDSFFKIATYLKKHKKKEELLLDAGDFHDFSHPVMMGSNGLAGMKLLASLDYDAICPGNNETFAGLDVLQGLHNNKTKLVCCNLTNNEGHTITNLHKSMILERKGVRFLVIGIAPFAGNYNDFSSMLNVYSNNPYEFIEKELTRLKGEYDFSIILSHIGITEDIQLAKMIQGIDIIIGGHSHTEMDQVMLVNKTVIHQSGKHGQYIGKLTLEIDNHEIVSFKGNNIKTADILEDEMTKKLFNHLEEEAYKQLSIPLYQMIQPLSYDPINENPLTNFIADALYSNYPCDFAYINSGIVNFGLEGDVSIKKLLECSPSHLNPTHMLIKGQQLVDALILSLDQKHCLEAGIGPGFRGKLIGRLHVSYNVKIIKSSPLQIWINDEAIDLNKEYHIVSSDYLQRGSGYPSLESQKEVCYENGFIRDVLLETLNKEEYYQYIHQNRWITPK